MQKLLIALLIIFAFCGCNDNNTPNVSDIKVDITVQRFEKDFFSADTNNILQSMEGLQKKYPYFFSDFVQNIVIAGPEDTSLSLPFAMAQYIRNARPLYNTIKDKNQNLLKLEKELQQGFKYVKYYYPDYKVPQVITYVGLVGDPSVAVSKDALIIGLHMYAGKDFAAYNTLDAQQVFPQYISRRFEPVYITANCFQNVAMDIYPDNSKGRPLLEQMIEKGKQWYLLDKFLPTTADSLKTGYTNAQIAWCQKNEGIIWVTLSKNTDLYTSDPLTLQNYIGESPKTEGMPDSSPGNIGQWIGWQIVKTFAEKNKQINLKQLLATNAQEILQGAKYKPR
jgi:hypothetical protein